MSGVYRLDGDWLLGTDQENTGRARGYAERPAPAARRGRVPGAIEETFPGYDGVVWYWQAFAPPAPPDGRSWSALRFWAADYYAEVWLNGQHLGSHEGGETPFTLDTRAALRPDGQNLLAVRLVHVGAEPIDDFRFEHVPHGIKTVPFRPGRFHNYGGIWQAVELLAQAPVRLADFFAEPRVATEEVVAHLTLCNDGAEVVAGRLEVTAGRRDQDGPLAGARRPIRLLPGETRVDVTLHLPNAVRWSLDTPHLYRLAARLELPGVPADELGARFGFREFTFRDGFFRLNDERIILKGTHTVGHYPIGLVLPRGPEMLRQELLNLKLMGLNCCRSLGRLMFPEQLDLCDELGLMVYQETLAAWLWEPSPAMGRRFDSHVREMILRDRNHPSVTIWGLLNETPDNEIFRHAVGMLPLVRELDPTRMVLLNSGRWDDAEARAKGAMRPPGPVALPYQSDWSQGFADWHHYVTRPLADEAIATFRTVGTPDNRLFQSEYGNGSAIDPVRITRLFEQHGASDDLEDGQLYRQMAARLATDFRRYGVDEVFAVPSDLVRASEALHAENRAFAIAALRANPNLCGYSITGMLDHTMVGEGLMTIFREPKRATIDALRDAWDPVQWSVFVDRMSVYQGEPVHVESLLVDEDVLRPGTYPARLQIMGPTGLTHEQTGEVVVPDGGTAGRPSMVYPVFDTRVVLDGPPGRYEVRVLCDSGTAALGRTRLYVSDPVGEAAGAVAVWDADNRLADWLGARGLRVTTFDPRAPGPADRRVLVNAPPVEPGAAALGPLLDWIEQGGTAVFLSPVAFGLTEENRYGVFWRGSLRWCPFGEQVALKQARGCWWAVDHILKDRPVLTGLPARRLMDLHYYRLVYPRWSYVGLRDGDVAVAAFGIGTCGEEDNYWAGVDLATLPWGRGRAILSTLLVAEHVGRDPAADRLLLNLATADLT